MMILVLTTTTTTMGGENEMNRFVKVDTNINKQSDFSVDW